MKNLGKIIILLTLFLSSLQATVTAKIVPVDVFEGDSTRYELTITGSNVTKPVLSDICGNDITATGSQTSITSINGEYKKSYTLSYEFTPRKSCTIAPIAVVIDGKTEYSNSVSVNVLPRTQDLSADFVLQLESSKKELYVGEPFSVKLQLKQKRGVDAVDSKFIAPEFKGFWIKSESKPQRTQDSRYVITTVVYKLAPQREGKLSIEPAELKIASRVGVNNWGTLIPQVRWRTYYSNRLEVNVKALPNNVKLIGDFTMNVSVDKREVNPNEAVNLTLKLLGSGNFEDVESFKPFVPDVNVFDEEIELLDNGLRQKIVFVGERDFTIPSFTLEYFDLKTKKIKTIKTEPIEIKVRGGVAKKKLEITRDTPHVEKSDTVKPEIQKSVISKINYLYVAVAFFIGLIIGLFIVNVKNMSGSSE